MKTASVERPLLVRMGGAPLRARAWKARKIKPKLSMRKRRGTGNISRIKG
jgi:hypothetical protein